MNNKRVKRIAIVLVWLIVIGLVITSFSFSIFAESGNGGKTVTQQLEDMESILKYIEKNYKDDVDINLLIDGAYQGIFEQLDAYSKYYSSEEDAAAFSIYSGGEFSGTGAQIKAAEGGAEIVGFTAGSPAEKAGLAVGDIITAVDGVSCKNVETSEISAMLRGEEGTTVKITVNRGGTSKVYNVVRSKIQMNSVSFRMIDDTTGYLGISNFYASTPDEITEAWNKMKETNPNIKNLIVDIRDNPGGLVSSAITSANLFLDPGMEIMSYYNKDGVVTTYVADGEKVVDVPVRLLVNSGSASAAEIFAGALKDNYAAVLVGSRTFGKGVAQTVTKTDTGAYMKLSVYYFVTPDKNKINEVGIAPHYTVYNGDNTAAIKRYNAMGNVAAMDEGKKYKIGEKGLNVYAAQQRLSILGYNVPLNGLLEEKTALALMDLQKKNKLYVYGALDFTTMNCLEKEYTRNIFGIADDVQLETALALIK